MFGNERQPSGFTQVEMMIAIIVIGIALSCVIPAISTANRSDSDPLGHQQMLAIAEELQDEALHKPFAVNGTAPINRLQHCGAGADRTGFDDISDYAGYETKGICDSEGNPVRGLEDYDVRISIDGSVSLGHIGNGNAKRITVSVTHGAESITLIGWRTQWAQ